MRHTISVLVENKFGVLARVSGMFSGRGFNIDSLNVAPTHDASLSRITTVLKGDEAALDNGLALWVSGDNLWKGAALNAIQNAELMVREGLLKPKASLAGV